MKKRYLAVALSVAALAGCGIGKAVEPLRDSKIQGRNDGPAHVGNMPDGFSNWAGKCDGPNMVYVLFKGDSAYGSISVVKDDPRCTGVR